MSISTDSTIAVIGAGAMGSGIAQVAAGAGHRVILVDAGEAALARSRQAIAEALDKQVQRGRLAAEARGAQLARLQWTRAIADAAPAALAIEAIVEDPAAKAALFARLEAVVGPQAVIASNTSSLAISALASGLDRPQRFAGLHFFNPVPVMKLVEVVPGALTDPRVTADLLGLMQRWGKVAVPVRDVPGFIVNRVARPYYAEGFAAWGEGVAAASVDHAMEAAGGFRMGPLALADMIGHDVNYPVAVSVYEAYEGRTRFRPQPAQQALFAGGQLGRKSGGGVYDYGAPLPAPAFVAPGVAPAAIDIAAERGAAGALADLAAAAGIAVNPAADLPPESLRAGGFVLAFGDGRPLCARDGTDVLIDHARDLAAAPALVITARSDAAARAAAGLLQALGKQALALPDRPGQLVLRTLAQLANAAGDAVADGVAGVEDIDAAMRFGANHPEGPLAWAARFGHARLAAVLTHIAVHAGDPAYAPARGFGAPEFAL